MSSSPFLAHKLKVEEFVFLQRHLLYATLALVLIVWLSTFKKHSILISSLLFLGIVIVMLFFVPFLGSAVKGAKRWLNIAGFSIQPSELVKPPLSIVSAWLLSQWAKGKFTNGFILSLSLVGIITTLILLQPDLGTTGLILMTWGCQLFVSGFSFKIMAYAALSGVGVLGLSYLFLPHVQNRLNAFLFPDMSDKYGVQYQIQKAMRAFQEGGLWGKGPGEGIIKKHIPDAHADFIFSVAGEEFGLILSSTIIAMYLIIFWRSISKLEHIQNLFSKLAIVGLSCGFTLQALINIASNLQLIPTKGMPLPFLSYGGSSIISAAILGGFILALTKRSGEL